MISILEALTNQTTGLVWILEFLIIDILMLGIRSICKQHYFDSFEFYQRLLELHW